MYNFFSKLLIFIVHHVPVFFFLSNLFRCETYVNLPAQYCHLEQDPNNPCCERPVCNFMAGHGEIRGNRSSTLAPAPPTPVSPTMRPPPGTTSTPPVPSPNSPKTVAPPTVTPPTQRPTPGKGKPFFIIVIDSLVRIVYPIIFHIYFIVFIEPLYYTPQKSSVDRQNLEVLVEDVIAFLLFLLLNVFHEAHKHLR